MHKCTSIIILKNAFKITSVIVLVGLTDSYPTLIGGILKQSLKRRQYYFFISKES